MEYELKFAATPQVQQAISQRLGEQWQGFAMHTTYYDAPDGGLSAKKWMLRHRLENDAHICTLKTPAGDARGEWEVEAEHVLEAVPKLCKLGAPAQLIMLTRDGLVPVCGAQFTRRAYTITLPEGTVEVALDEGILYAGDRSQPLCEVEVELKSGAVEAVDRFAAELAADFGLQRLEKSKFKRALSLREAL